MKKLACLIILGLILTNCKKETSQITTEKNNSKTVSKPNSEVKVNPISHATMVLEHENTVVYVDPVGDVTAFKDLPFPKLVLITDIHGDHLSVKTLEALGLENVTMIVPQAVADKLPETLKDNLVILGNGKTSTIKNPQKGIDIKVQAIPMYNLREEALKFHTKGRGNGYVLTLGGKRIYISGDTEDIPEMRALKDIDIAFVCMNLPYTMTVEKAADAVLEFKPKTIYPYHYRGTEGLSDVALFKTLVSSQDSSINIIQLNWYN